MSSIDLTPAEAMVLLEPEDKHGREAFKVSLMWLLAQRHLKATPIPAGWFSRGSTQLSPGPRAGASLPRDLQEVVDTVAASGTGLMNDIVKVARSRLGADLNRFQSEYILPALSRRDLVRSFDEQRRILFVPFTRTRHQRTAAGDVQARRIEALFEDARRIPGYLDRNPAQAAALAATLGGLIFLLPELRPHLDDIATAMRRPTDQTDSGYSPATSTSDSSAAPTSSGDHRQPTEDASGTGRDDFQVHFDLADPGLQDFDNIAASLDSLDSSFDSSADSGGGGDGGGDGGGGGD